MLTPRVRVAKSAHFQQIVADCKPVINERSDSGPCKELWTKEYLTSAIGGDSNVRSYSQ